MKKSVWKVELETPPKLSVQLFKGDIYKKNLFTVIHVWCVVILSTQKPTNKASFLLFSAHLFDPQQAVLFSTL